MRFASIRSLSLASTLVVLSTLTTGARAEEKEPDRRWATWPLFVASGGLAYTSGKASPESGETPHEGVFGGFGNLAGCACGYLRPGGGYLFLGLYAHVSLGVNAATGAQLLADLSFGPMVTFGLSDEHEIGVRYRADVNANLARDVGSSDDAYQLDILGRFRNTGVEVGFRAHPFSFPAMSPFSEQHPKLSIAAWQRFGEEETKPARKGAYYLRVEVDKWSPVGGDSLRDYSGVEVRASIGWGIGSD